MEPQGGIHGAEACLRSDATLQRGGAVLMRYAGRVCWVTVLVRVHNQKYCVLGPRYSYNEDPINYSASLWAP